MFEGYSLFLGGLWWQRFDIQSKVRFPGQSRGCDLVPAKSFVKDRSESQNHKLIHWGGCVINVQREKKGNMGLWRLNFPLPRRLQLSQRYSTQERAPCCLNGVIAWASKRIMYLHFDFLIWISADWYLSGTLMKPTAGRTSSQDELCQIYHFAIWGQACGPDLVKIGPRQNNPKTLLQRTNAISRFLMHGDLLANCSKCLDGNQLCMRWYFNRCRERQGSFNLFY